MHRLTIFVAAMFVASPAELLAHPGGLDASGCHNNRKTGEYHCHRGGGVAPLRSPKKDAGHQRAERDRPQYYSNCDSARAAGAAPLRVGDPGYRIGLDRDGDGLACE